MRSAFAPQFPWSLRGRCGIGILATAARRRCSKEYPQTVALCRTGRLAKFPLAVGIRSISGLKCFNRAGLNDSVIGFNAKYYVNTNFQNQISLLPLLHVCTWSRW